MKNFKSALVSIPMYIAGLAVVCCASTYLCEAGSTAYNILGAAFLLISLSFMGYTVSLFSGMGKA